MPNFINPFTDAGFKRIFGCEVNKDLLMHFLNLLLVDRYVISDVTFLN
ncbi:MAG: PD-(D/E)XK nuclease family transposase, partial [Bacteroidales bacterium]|nr:PD-(D/E)XK nuclease family transposase [Bacteroidales bacterium]